METSSIRAIYCSGPMSGIKDHNTPAFRAASKFAEGFGIKVFDPSLNDPSLPRHILLKMDLLMIAQCDAIVMLPDWEYSPGACWELMLARELKLHILKVGKYSLTKDLHAERCEFGRVSVKHRDTGDLVLSSTELVKNIASRVPA